MKISNSNNGTPYKVAELFNSFPIDNDLYSDIDKHNRYLSDFNDNLIRMDIRINGSDDEKIHVIDLNKEVFAGYGGTSVFKSPIVFSSQTGLSMAFKLVLNDKLFKHDKSSDIASEISGCLNLYKRFYSWMFQHSIYNLKDIKREDIEGFLSNFIEHGGWWNLLEYDNILETLYENIKTQPDMASYVVSQSLKNTTICYMNMNGLSEITGLPFGPRFIPAGFVNRIRSEYYPERKEYTAGESHGSDLTESVLRSVFEGLNDLSEISLISDRIEFIPFPNSSKLSKSLATSRKDGRTKNITPDFAARYLSHAMDWVYTKAAGVIELLETARTAADEILDKDVKKIAKSVYIGEMVNQKYSEIKEQYGFEFEKINIDHKDNANTDVTLKEMLRTVQTAAFVLVGVNLGRRKNELLGEGQRPYGLYLGCVKSVNSDIDLKSIDIYVEKTLKDWMSFMCNQLVIDAINVLEEIYQLIRPLRTDKIEPKDNLADARKDKLFVLRNLSNPVTWCDDKMEPFTYKNNSRLFYKLLDSPVELDHKTHPNRRLFACMYYYRFEFPELFALKNHLVHDTTKMTFTYITDPDTRKLGDHMSKQWSKEKQGQEEVLKETGSEYHKDIIREILDGNAVGGYYPRLIAKRLKTLSKNTKFDLSNMDKDEMSKTIRDSMEKRGYFPQPKSNGACLAGTSKRTTSMANCKDDEKSLNPQDASPETCHGCVHQFTNVNHRNSMHEELDELNVTAKDFRLPHVARIQAEEQANDLERILVLEDELSTSNATFLKELLRNTLGEDSI